MIYDARGSAFADMIAGNAENNYLCGAAGDDIMTGGLGNDTFAFGDLAGTDRITNFEQGADRILILGPETSVDQLSVVDQDYSVSVVKSGGVIEFSGLQLLGEQNFIFEII